MICRCPCCCNYVLPELLVAPIVYGVADDAVRVAVGVALVVVLLLLLLLLMLLSVLLFMSRLLMTLLVCG